MTSNPAIFEKSILGSADYDDELKRARRRGQDRARDLPRDGAARRAGRLPTCCGPSTTRTGGVDGYVSWEVAPRLAHDTEGTLEQGRMYWDLVDRPNLMIKIPATDAGIPAIEEALFDGLNINVTLLFSVAAVRARDGGLHPRDGAPAGGGQAARPPLASPRSSSRAWTPRSTSASRRSGNTELQGTRRASPTPAPPTRRSSASSRASASPTLREAGCPVQRPLWASTGVKNPAYPPTLYV